MYLFRLIQCSDVCFFRSVYRAFIYLSNFYCFTLFKVIIIKLIYKCSRIVGIRECPGASCLCGIVILIKCSCTYTIVYIIRQMHLIAAIQHIIRIIIQIRQPAAIYSKLLIAHKEYR